MRFVKTILSVVVMALSTGAVALAQEPPVRVDVHTSETTTTWYTDPVWLAIGGLAVLLIIVLVVMAARGGRKSTTTVVR
jgi:hypothetical protein